MAFRIRVNMSEIGSVTGIYYLLPARLCESRNQTFVGHFSQATAAQAEVPAIAPWSPAYTTAVVQAHLRVFAFGDKYLALVFLVNHGCFSHVALSSPSDSFSESLITVGLGLVVF